jgi:hypothetical protein
MDAAGADADQARLHQLGYRQELKRGLSYVILLSFFMFLFPCISYCDHFKFHRSL